MKTFFLWVLFYMALYPFSFTLVFCVRLCPRVRTTQFDLAYNRNGVKQQSLAARSRKSPHAHQGAGCLLGSVRLLNSMHHRAMELCARHSLMLNCNYKGLDWLNFTNTK